MKKITKKLLMAGAAVLCVTQAHAIGPFEAAVEKGLEPFSHPGFSTKSPGEKTAILAETLVPFLVDGALFKLTTHDLFYTYGVDLPEALPETVPFEFLTENLVPALVEKGVTPYAVAKHLMTDPIASLPQTCLQFTTLCESSGLSSDGWDKHLNRTLPLVLAARTADMGGAVSEHMGLLAKYRPYIGLLQATGMTDDTWPRETASYTRRRARESLV